MIRRGPYTYHVFMTHMNILNVKDPWHVNRVITDHTQVANDFPLITGHNVAYERWFGGEDGIFFILIFPVRKIIPDFNFWLRHCYWFSRKINRKLNNEPFVVPKNRSILQKYRSRSKNVIIRWRIMMLTMLNYVIVYWSILSRCICWLNG